MLGPSCLHRAQQLNQRWICPAYFRGHEFQLHSLSLRWQDWPPFNNRDGHGWWPMWQIMTISHWWIWALCVLMTINMGKSSVDVIGQVRIQNKSQTRPQAVLEKKAEYDAAKFFCWHKLFSTHGGVTARNIILIYYLILPPPSDAVVLHYEPQRGSRPWAA